MSPGEPGDKTGSPGIIEVEKRVEVLQDPCKVPSRRDAGENAPNTPSKMVLHVFSKLESQSDVIDTDFFEAGIRKYLMLLVK